MKASTDPIWAAATAQKFAQEIGLPLRSYWTGGIARSMARSLAAGHSRRSVERKMRFRLGLKEHK